MDKSIFKQFQNLEVLVVGDVMLDRYLNGQVTRISPEAPVPIVHLQQEEIRLGGAANVALNLKALGASVHLCSIVGKDTHGTLLLDLLPKHELSNSNLIQSTERQTTVKTRVLSGSQQLLRVDREDTHDLVETEEVNLLENVTKLLSKYKIKAIILQDYNKGILTEKVIQSVTSLAKAKQIPIIIDPKKKNFLSYQGVDLFKPNLKEVRESVPFEVQANLESLQQASAYLRRELNHHHTMITLSEKGIFIDDGKNALIVPTQARKIADVCGAGDTVVSIVALALALEMPMQEIAVLGNLAGGQVCEKVGVVPVNRAQLEEEYRFLREG